jgi:hypothetical protein
MKKIRTQAVLFILSALILWGCSGFFGERSGEKQGPGASLAEGYGTVQVTVSRETARTVIPDPAALADLDLEYWFARDGGEAGKKEPEGNSFILQSGNYTLMVKGFLKEGNGLVSLGDASFAVAAGEDAGTVNVILRPVVTGEGTGTLAFALVYPAGVTVETLTLTPVAGGGEIDLTESAPGTSGTDPVTLSGTKSNIPVGYYLLRVTLSTVDGAVAGKTEVVHIYQNLTAQTELDKYTFTAEDFRAGQPVNTGVSVWVNEDDGAILASNDNVTISKSGSGSFTAAVNGGYGDIKWYVNGTLVTGTTGNSITINAADYPKGRYILGVTVTKNGIPYSTDIRFTVDTPAPPIAASPHERLGVYVYDRNPAGVDYFADWAGLDVKYAEDFMSYDYWQSYTGIWANYNPQYWSAWKAAKPGRKLVLAVSPFPKDGLTGGNDYDKAMSSTARVKYQEAANGDYNVYYAQLGQKLKDLGLGDTIIRFGHEMSGTWYVYSISVGATEEIRQEKQINYGKAFNEFAKTLSAIPGTDFEFCWNPATDSDPTYLARCYPGDEYVDYIAFDQYDYWLSAYDHDTYHNSTDPAVRLTYQQTAWNQMMTVKWGNPNWFAAFAQQHNKPLAIAEWGLWRDNRNSGYDNPYFIEKMYEWINAHDIAWHTYFMYGDVSHSLYDTVVYPLASQKFQELWNPAGSPQVSPAIPPSDVSGYNAATLKKGRDAVRGGSVALVSDPWAWSDLLAGMWTQNDTYNADNMSITFENCPASSGFALVYQLWHSNLSNSESDNNQRVSLYVNGSPVKTSITLTHGGRGWGDSYKIAYFDDVTIPEGASITFKADQWNWAWTRLNFDYIVFK